MRARLSARQRRVLLGLGLANLFVLIAAGALFLTPEPAPQPVHAPAPPETTLTCRTAAARALADLGVAGTIALRADSSIEFVIGGDDPTDAWDAFAVSAEIGEHGCGPYDPIRVDLPDPSLAPDHRLVVEARWADVKAWSLGQIDDEALSSRARRSAYVRRALPAQP
ncbi:MAG TPA: hypothetical protein VJ754_10145 [Anaerolineae bacterium]|nr:hypothetical protein [Anaerolineae bacterium]